MGDPLRVGLIGYGYWGPNLARNMYQLRDAELAAVADVDDKRLEEPARLYHARTYTDYRALLADPQLDAVVVATPARTHFEITRQALERGKHVLVEKPLAMSSPEARELIALAERVHRVLMVGHTFEYNAAVWKIRELIEAGAIGDVYYVYANRVNLGRVQRDINALWSIAPHDISILLHVLGDMPIEVSARGATFLNEHVEDVVFVTLTFPKNILAHVHASWLDPLKLRRMTFVGSTKMIVYDDVDAEAKLRIYDKGVYRRGSDFGEPQLKVHSGDIFIPRIDLSEPLHNECAHFIECVRESKPPRTDGASGLRVIQVLEAAQESLARNGIPVAVGRMKVADLATSSEAEG
ncbi:MAG: Gfo/Idh/MocA family oxidoreductase [Chloroflexi bacterium]|nr:Gfo/Idh/MocA family oxidoreductase [Chloroflexota bacterium]